jgi:hypothetical protein
MSQKHHAPGPVPPGNRPATPFNDRPDMDPTEEPTNQDGTGFQEEDPKRRLGDFTGKGEHSIQQPGGKNDSDR